MRNPSSSATSAVEKRSSSGGGKMALKRGPWTVEEDELLTKCINKEGEGKWRTLPTRAGLARCGKSCRLRWMNYLRPSVKRGQIAPDEEDLILRLHRLLGNRWSLIAGRIPGRTDNEIKNYWNTHLSKKLINQGIDPKTHRPLLETSTSTYSNKQLVGSKLQGNKSDSDNSDGFEGDGLLEHAGFRNATCYIARETGCYSDGYGSHQTNLMNSDAGSGYHVNLQQQGCSQGVSNEDDGQDHGIINRDEGIVAEDDGVFSSFLNSLINDDMFV